MGRTSDGLAGALLICALLGGCGAGEHVAPAARSAASSASTLAATAVAPASSASTAASEGDTVVVPDVGELYRDIDAAISELRAGGLAVAVTAWGGISSTAAVVVGAQEPAPGTRVARGSVVRLTPATGALGSLACTPSPPAVPEIDGLALDEAAARLEQAGFHWTIVGTAPALAVGELADTYAASLAVASHVGVGAGEGDTCPDSALRLVVVRATR